MACIDVPITHYSSLITGSLSLVTHHSSPILAIVDEVAKWAGAFKDEDKD